MYLEIKQKKSCMCLITRLCYQTGKNSSKPTYLGAKFTHEAKHEQDAMFQAQMLFLVSFSRIDPW